MFLDITIGFGRIVIMLQYRKQLIKLNSYAARGYALVYGAVAGPLRLFL